MLKREIITCHLKGCKKKQTMKKFSKGDAEKCIEYVENTLDYAEILTNKIGNKAFPMYRTTLKQKALQEARKGIFVDVVFAKRLKITKKDI